MKESMRVGKMEVEMVGLMDSRLVDGLVDWSDIGWVEYSVDGSGGMTAVRSGGELAEKRVVWMDWRMVGQWALDSVVAMVG